MPRSPSTRCRSRPWRTASARDCSCDTSWPADRAWLAAHRATLAPSKHSSPPGIDVGDGQRHEKDQHFPKDVADQSGRQQRLITLAEGRHRPRIEKEQFDIEHKKQNCDKIE